MSKSNIKNCLETITNFVDKEAKKLSQKVPEDEGIGIHFYKQDLQEFSMIFGVLMSISNYLDNIKEFLDILEENGVEFE